MVLLAPLQFQTNQAMPALQRLLRRPWAISAPLSHSRSCASHANPPGLDKLPEAASLPRVHIKKGKANLFLEGNPIVYAGAVEKVTGGNPASGSEVIVTDWKDCAIAWGVYNEQSMYRVRILQLDRAVRRDASSALSIEDTVRVAVRNAVVLRRTLNLPREDTTVYRLINSEGDNCSGLIVDVYGTHAVAVASAGWVLQHTESITAALKEEADGVQEVIWRYDSTMLEMEGVPAEAIPGATVGGNSAPVPSDAGTADEEQLLQIVEEGIKYKLNPYGQKTGFYADQRDSRVFLRNLAKGKRVLDLCCYTGAFALNTAAAGAESAVGVDSSQPAISLAEQNAVLNGVEDRCTFVCMSVEKYMEEAISMNKQFDVLILDPPKLAPSKKVLPQAQQKYTKLNAAAMQLVAPGGVLMTCSCSSAMTQSGDFTKMLVAASRKARRSMTIIRDAGASTDHVLNPSFAQGVYMTNVTVIMN